MISWNFSWRGCSGSEVSFGVLFAREDILSAWRLLKVSLLLTSALALP